MTTLAEQLDRLCRGDHQRVEILAERLLAAERPRQAATAVDPTSSVSQQPVPRCNLRTRHRVCASGSAMAGDRRR